MDTILTYGLFLVGVVLIVKGGDWFVDSASWIADASGIPKFIIGATIVSLATTLPEITVSVMAAIEGNSDLAIGNAVGSVTANVGLIMALSMLLMPTAVDKKKVRIKVILLFAAIAMLWLMSSLGGPTANTARSLTVVGSIPIFILFALFIVENLRSVKQETADNDRPEVNKKLVIKNVVFLAIGAACIVCGSNLLVDKGQIIAADLGVPDKVIGLTAIAIGTSLPELVTTLTSVIKKQPSLGMGNIIGANIIDICLILPICSFIQSGSLPITTQNLRLDLPVCLAVVLIALLPPLFTGKLRRWQGVVALLVYITYLALFCFGGGLSIAPALGIV